MLFIFYSKFLRGKVLCSVFHSVLTIFVTLTFAVDEDTDLLLMELLRSEEWFCLPTP